MFFEIGNIYHTLNLKKSDTNRYHSFLFRTALNKYVQFLNENYIDPQVQVLGAKHQIAICLNILLISIIICILHIINILCAVTAI